jgi:heat shock protein HtpX
MPEVAVYDAPDVNAFATGWNRNNALVAVSTGLLNTMSKDEAEAVLAHEVSHVANGDMVTLALIQGVVNTFVVFFAKLFGYFVDRVLLKNDDREGPGIGQFVAEIAAQLVLGVLASVIVMWFSRLREYRADAGGASLAGRHKMIAALERLKANHEQAAAMPQNMSAMAISSGGGFSRLFMTHPPLEERIAALRAGL